MKGIGVRFVLVAAFKMDATKYANHRSGQQHGCLCSVAFGTMSSAIVKNGDEKPA
jgi:hypothetical protein